MSSVARRPTSKQASASFVLSTVPHPRESTARNIVRAGPEPNHRRGPVRRSRPQPSGHGPRRGSWAGRFLRLGLGRRSHLAVAPAGPGTSRHDDSRARRPRAPTTEPSPAPDRSAGARPRSVHVDSPALASGANSTWIRCSGDAPSLGLGAQGRLDRPPSTGEGTGSGGRGAGPAPRSPRRRRGRARRPGTETRSGRGCCRRSRRSGWRSSGCGRRAGSPRTGGSSIPPRPRRRRESSGRWRRTCGVRIRKPAA